MPAGRPPKFETPEEMQERIDLYFTSLKSDEEERDEIGQIDNTPTITGLAYFLGFSDRHSFYDYEKREGFSHTVKKARTRIENWYEKTLMMGSPTGSIFALKNLGWKDKQSLEHTGENGGPIESAIKVYLPDNGRN